MNSTTPPPISRPRGRRGRGMRLPRSCYLLPKNCDLRPSRPRRPGGQKKPRPFSRGRPKSTPPLNQHQPAGKVTAVVCGTSRRPTAGLSNAPRCPPCLQHRGASRLVIDGQKFAISGHAFAGRLLNSEARDAGRCRGNLLPGGMNIRSYSKPSGDKLTADVVGRGLADREADDPKLSYVTLDPSAFKEDGGRSIAERINDELIAKKARFVQRG
jgi:hypothetical protein